MKPKERIYYILDVEVKQKIFSTKMNYVSFSRMWVKIDVQFCIVYPSSEQWVQEGALELRTAFSRDQANKVYVQDLILEDADTIWKLLQVSKLVST